MVDGHYGMVVDGVFCCSIDRGYFGFAVSAPVPITLLLRGTVVAIILTGKSNHFSVAIASTNALNNGVHWYNKNHHAAFHYSSAVGRVNSSTGAFTRHFGEAPFTAALTLRGFDHTVSFSVNGVLQHGVWALPTTDVFYLMLATGGAHTDNNIAVTDVSVAMTNLA